MDTEKAANRVLGRASMLPKPAQKKPLAFRPAEKKKEDFLPSITLRPKLAALDSNKQDNLTAFKTSKMARKSTITSTKETAESSHNQTRACRLPTTITTSKENQTRASRLPRRVPQQPPPKKHREESSTTTIRAEGRQDGAQLSLRPATKKAEGGQEAAQLSLLRAPQRLVKKAEVNPTQEKKKADPQNPSSSVSSELYLPNPLHLLLPDHKTDLDTPPETETLTQHHRWEDPQYCVQYANDIYQHLLKSETAKVYLITPELMSQQTQIVAKHRRVLLDWLIQVHMKFGLFPETLHICIDMIDRYLQVVDVPQKELQLVGITALFLSTKYEEIHPPSITDIAYIAADTYTYRQIRSMEISILRTLDYNLGRPNPLAFLRRYSKYMGASPFIHNLAKYFIEASYLSLDSRALLPSQCAVGALALATNIETRERMATIWTSDMEKNSWYSQSRAAVFARQVLKNVLSYDSLGGNAHATRYTSVKEKYTSKRFEAVAKQPWLLERLEALAKKHKLD